MSIGKKWLMSLGVGTILEPEWTQSRLCIGREGIHWLGGDGHVPGYYDWCFIHDDEGMLGEACADNCPVVGGLTPQMHLEVLSQLNEGDKPHIPGIVREVDDLYGPFIRIWLDQPEVTP